MNSFTIQFNINRETHTNTHEEKERERRRRGEGETFNVLQLHNEMHFNSDFLLKCDFVLEKI